jgi:hypothetical protein
MLRTTNMHLRFAQGIAVAAVVAALLGPTASATPLITDTLAPGGGASISGHHFVTSIPVSAEAYRFVAYTDTLAQGGSAAPTVGYRFITDTLAPGGANAVVSVPSGSGFNWTDAGAGALVALALMLAALTGRQLVTRRRRGQLAF